MVRSVEERVLFSPCREINAAPPRGQHDQSDVSAGDVTVTPRPPVAAGVPFRGTTDATEEGVWEEDGGEEGS